jgi:hypothetical protein
MLILVAFFNKKRKNIVSTISNVSNNQLQNAVSVNKEAAPVVDNSVNTPVESAKPISSSNLVDTVEISQEAKEKLKEEPVASIQTGGDGVEPK